MDYSKLTFGAPAAERDISYGLKDYFVESEAFYRIQQGEKNIIIGNRGSGKSAIFKILADREKNNGTLVIELSPDDYSYEMLTRVMVQEKAGSWAKQGAYAAAWKYLIYILIMKTLTSKGSKLKTGPAARIYTFLRDNFKGQHDNPIGILISYLKRLEGIKVAGHGVTLKTQELQSLYKLEEISDLIPDIVEICKHSKVIVLIDELDRGWDASEDSKAFVAGLFQAAVTINQVSSNLRVLISLRRELYDNIPALYEDAQKFRDVIEVILWDETSLLQLAAKRIQHSLSGLKDKSVEECWNAVFVDTLDYRQAKSFNYMVDRTLYRPREIIQFCTDAASKAKDHNTWPINYSTLSKAELVYSEDRTKDIAAEYKFQYPGLLNIFDVFRGRSYTLSREELEMLCLTITTSGFAVGAASKWVEGQMPDFLIDVLWRIGFLKAKTVGAVKALRRGGSSYLGPYQITNLNLHTINYFQVHPMFRTFLGLKETRERHGDDF